MDLHIAAELHRYYAEQRHMNNIHCICISSIYKLEGYSGLGPFEPEGDTLEDPLGSGEEVIDEEDDVEDDVEDEFLRLRDF